MLVQRGGGTQVFRTEFSESAQALWGTQGLFVADSQKGYLIDREGKVNVFKAPEGSNAEGPAFLDDELGAVSVTNEGFRDGFYHQ